MRPEDEAYFERLEDELDRAIEVATTAKELGEDPEPEVEIPIARDMADRVENILGIDGVAERVRELEGEFSREEAALELVEDFVEGRVGSYENRAGKIEGAVRTAVALLTEGVVAAPIEGIDRVEIEENDDGTEFVTVAYAGPIRSAGGTAQALSVLVADYARALLDVDAFKPRDDEVERYAEEIQLYSDETGLQYTPKDKESKFITKHCPVMLDGEATSDEEVSGFRDLERIDTNAARGGMCLVLAEGIALKAPKIQRYTRNLEEVEWPWLQDLIDGTIGEGDDGEDDASEDETSDSEAGDDADEAEASDADADDADAPEGPPRAEPNGKFLLDLIAGRPVFGHPSEAGGFRLRYGRTRNLGDATAGVHPASMRLVDDFLAPGTQIKTELPGKAAGIVPVDSIEGPTVRLANGDVRRIDDAEEAMEVRNGVEAVLDLGEYLVNYGEFVENNHELVPAAYATEWWTQDLAAAGVDVRAMRDDPTVDLAEPDPETAIEWAREYDAPLHPAYTYCWHDLDVASFELLADAVASGSVVQSDGASLASQPATTTGALVLEDEDAVRQALDVLLVEHSQGDGQLTVPTWTPLALSLGLTEARERTWDALPEDARTYDGGDNAVRAVNAVAPFEVREKAPTRVGCRMGRPEKSEDRELSPAVHALYPIGEAGGNQRDVAAATHHADTMSDTPGEVPVEVGVRKCEDCDVESHRPRCPECGQHTEPHYTCPDCEMELEPDQAGRVECPRCEIEGDAVEQRLLDVASEYREALENVGEREHVFDVLKGVKGLTSELKTPEPLEKGVLRAKHDVSAFKDGTVRYDMTDLPVTAVKPAELDVTVDQFHSLGYEEDVHGDPLTHEEQVVELKVQDVILSEGGADHMLKTADFVDDLLASYYDMEPYYEFEERDDLVGELVFGMAPHTSAAVVGRIVGFTNVAGGYAHPYFHAAKRRNCFHPDTKIWYEDEDGSQHYGRIEEFVEARLDDPREDDVGTLVQDLDGEVRVPSLSENGEQTYRPVNAVSKHPSPDHLVRITTRSGRSTLVTPTHELHVYDLESEELVGKAARDLNGDDQLVTPKSVSPAIDNTERIQFDLLEECIASEEVPNDRLMIKGLDKGRLYDLFETAFEEHCDGEFYPLQSTTEILDTNKKTLSNYLYRGSFPVDYLEACFSDPEELLSFVPDDVTLGVKHDRTEVDRFVELNERVATLLGYYAAEGFTRKQQTPKGTIHQTTICGTEQEARSFFVDVLEDEFGTEPYEENDRKVTVSGRLLRVFFDSILQASARAESKRVPDPIFAASDDIVAAFLRGYFSGDGTVHANLLEVTATTVSEELKEDLLGLLSRLGIKGRVHSPERVPLRQKFPEFYDVDDDNLMAKSYVVTISSEDAVRFHDTAGFHLTRKMSSLGERVSSIASQGRRVFDGGDEDYLLEEIDSIELVESETESVYCLTVEETHSLIANDMSQKQCDGDEDCVMLLLDGLLNFSKKYLPDQRGGQMDAPLVMSSRIDPQEIDDEAHNVDVVEQYPREFYEATRELADPEDVDVEIVEDTLGTDLEYCDFGFTHATTDIAAGPDLSAYKTLDSMMDKMDAQLELARTLRSVDEVDVAERVIEYHFLPDLIGNLRAFSRQEVRCLDCGEKFRRAPLSGDCRECGGDVTLTVHEGSVNKYMETAIEVAEEYGCRKYTKQRLEVLQRAIDRVFENDKNKASSLDDFM